MFFLEEAEHQQPEGWSRGKAVKGEMGTVGMGVQVEKTEREVLNNRDQQNVRES